MGVKRRKGPSVGETLFQVFEELYECRRDPGGPLPSKTETRITMCLGMARETLAQTQMAAQLAKFPILADDYHAPPPEALTFHGRGSRR